MAAPRPRFTPILAGAPTWMPPRARGLLAMVVHRLLPLAVVVRGLLLDSMQPGVRKGVAEVVVGVSALLDKRLLLRGPGAKADPGGEEEGCVK